MYSWSLRMQLGVSFSCLWTDESKNAIFMRLLKVNIYTGNSYAMSLMPPKESRVSGYCSTWHLVCWIVFIGVPIFLTHRTGTAFVLSLLDPRSQVLSVLEQIWSSVGRCPYVYLLQDCHWITCEEWCYPRSGKPCSLEIAGLWSEQTYSDHSSLYWFVMWAVVEG